MAKKNGLKIPELVFNEEKRKQYEESFKLANNDPEMIELAEEGLGDIAEMFERINYFQIGSSNQPKGKPILYKSILLLSANNF